MPQTSGNVKQPWEVLNDILGKKTESTFPNDVSYVNYQSTDRKEIVNVLNIYFVDIGPKLSQSISNQNSSF